MRILPSASRILPAGALFLLITALPREAGAALTLTINEFNSNRFSATLGGYFDADTIGDQLEWLAIKANSSLNNGQNVPWVSNSVGFAEFNENPAITIVTDTVVFSGLSITEKDIAANGQRWGDSIYFRTSGPIIAGTLVSGTITIDGAGIFSPGGVQTFQLVSGFDDAKMDFKRVEASVQVPEPSSSLFLLLEVSSLFRHRRRHELCRL